MVKRAIKKIGKEKKPVRKKVERTRNLGSMTEAEFFGKIRSALRNSFRYWKPAMKALENASRPAISRNKRLKKQYKCSVCNHWFARKDIEIHHIIECGSLRIWDDVVPFIQRLCCEDVNGYLTLCKQCHKGKHSKQ